MQCLIVNRNYPPESGVTGASAAELANYLIAQGAEVTVAAINGTYAGGGDSRVPAAGKVHRLPAVYNGKQKALRLLSTLIEGRRLIRFAQRMNIPVWITMTDPPLINYWVARERRKGLFQWVNWTMDLYPDAFEAAGLVTAAHPIYRHFDAVISRQNPDFIVALGPRQREFLNRRYGSDVPGVLLPCGISQSRKKDPPDWFDDSGRIILGYVGNLGEAHSLDFVESTIRRLDPEKHRFILATYGAKADSLINSVKGAPGLTVLNAVRREDLYYIDVHLATLMPHWDHICVPSKAVSAICGGASVLYCGSDRNDNWTLLGAAGWRIDPEGDIDDQVKVWFQDISINLLAEKKAAARRVAGELEKMKQEAFAGILEFVQRANQAAEPSWPTQDITGRRSSR